MNAIRHFLLRDSWLKRGLFCLVFAVLLLRALLSGTVMLDPDAPEGSFGLVLCSGFGPMFPVAATGSENLALPMGVMSTGGMVMPGMHDGHHDAASVKSVVSTEALPADTGRHMSDQDPSDSGSLCPFSAAFLTAIVSLFIVSLFLGVVTSGRFWRNAGPVNYLSLIRFGRPLSRGPPAVA